jgi:alpha-beta hydrolase superfamily lysophospholipase/SAM-dependent methyltransferase
MLSWMLTLSTERSSDRAAAPAHDAIPPSEHTFTSHDGATIFYRAWPARQPAAHPRSILLFHRGHEHSGRWQETVQALAPCNCNIYAWDQRGHGRSSGERGGAPSIAAVTKDADLWARHLAREHDLEPRNTVIVSHSVGAVIAAAWVHDFAPPIRGLVLGAPALRVKLYVPLAIPALRLKQRLLGSGTVKSYVKARMLTHDPAEAAAYKADPAIFRQIAVNVLLDLHDTSTRLIADAGAITTPTLILAAERDWIVHLEAQKEFYRNLGSPTKQFEILPGFYHALFHERERPVVTDRIRAFIDECFTRAPQTRETLIRSDKGGHTKTEYDLLRTPGSLRWKATRAMVRLGGALSEGMRLGRRWGFDSGVMLDYVYENKSHGVTPIGKLIDRSYLNAIGWRGIRIRRENLQAVLRSAIDRTSKDGRAVVILDIASGPGRYVLETIKGLNGRPATAILRDYKQENLAAARAHAERLGLTNIRIEHGDAFDRDGLGALNPHPTIAIVSGLYELFPENEPVRRSLAGLAKAVRPGGLLVYTCQPWHPQVEFIARALTNREGRPWIMRRRTQAEMDALVEDAGFEKISQEIDPWGIFTVSVARRIEQ